MEKKNQKSPLRQRQKQNIGGKMKKIKEKNRFAKKVIDYLLSDTYMYAPLVSSTTNNNNTGPLGYLKKATAAISNKSIANEHEQTDRLINGICLERPSPSPLGRRGEAVKHMVHYKAHILSGVDYRLDNKFSPLFNNFATTSRSSK